MEPKAKVTLSMPADAAQRLIAAYERDPQSVKEFFESIGIKIEDISPAGIVKKENQENDIYSKCHVCSCNGKRTIEFNNDKLDLIDIKKCSRCGAIYGRAPRSVVLKHVNLDEMEVNCDPNDQEYFDFTFPGTDPSGREYRSHGWYDTFNLKVIQFG
jgi:hypothetical protein